jgi:hypothetical protein
MKRDKPSDRDERVKDEVSYGAVIFYQIMSCVKSSKGKDIIVRFEDNPCEAVSVKNYDDYKTDVDQLVSLVEIISDDEFDEDIKRLDREVKDKWLRIDDKDNFKRDWKNPAYNYSDKEIYTYNQRLLYEYNFKRFKACLRLLKRQGIMVESLIKGAVK